MSAPATPKPVTEKPGDAKQPTPPAGGGPSPLARLGANPKMLALGVAVLVAVVSAVVTGSGSWPHAWTVDFSTPLGNLDEWIVSNRQSSWIFVYFLLHFSNWANAGVDGITTLLDSFGWIGVTVLGTLVAWAAGGADFSRRALRVAGTALGVFVVCGVLGMWERTMETLSLMIVCVAVAVLLGFLLGLVAGLSDRGERMLRPVFDTMQVMPAFAFLLPFVLIFGIGIPSALIATVIYAAPPTARLTSLGLRGADPTALEASASLGASPWQRLRTARLPLARRQMMLGINQTIMMCLSMVVLAALIGSGGLGADIYEALAALEMGQALTAGIAVVLLAVLLDRTTAVAGERLDDVARPRTARLRSRVVWSGTGVLTIVFAMVGALIWEQKWPYQYTIDFATPAQSALTWLINHIKEGIPGLGGTYTWAQGFTEGILNPLRDGLDATPWWAVVLVVAVLGWIVGTWRAALSAVLALVLIGVMGLWGQSVDTLSQVLAGLFLTLLFGFLIGIAAGRSDRLERVLRPILDTMQTMPQFVYLIPVVYLFSLSRAAGIAAAVIYAMPAVIRITAQGVRYVDPASLEAAQSLGATRRQQLLGVQLPLARRQLLVAVNQGVVLVLSMVVIGGLVGGGALGYSVVRGLSKGDLGLGLPAGIAIVCLGVVLDRITQPSLRKRAES
ncbi:MAG TPA: ABC transporter permease subunit [Streptomyces sp.]|nr:ABC transporter permease subunit [Streptomyces sp.]